MKRAILLATVALLAMLVLVPMAVAQDTTMMMMGSTMMMDSTMMGGGEMMGSTMMMGATTAGVESNNPLPGSGGPAILLPAAALLVGSGILTYAILRRR